MHDHGDAAELDRPWRRPGRLRYARERLARIVRPPVTVYEPDPAIVAVDHDQPVTTRDGTILRVNVHRPTADGPHPVVLCAHPYGKDALPRRTRSGRYRISFQFRALRQTGPMRFSSLTSWEAPDPAWWVEQGYVVVNCDLRGAGTSDGTGALMSPQEGEDVYDLVEWAGAQPWSTGAVGMLGVSYLAISQWRTAALQPPSLRAIVPWEGLTDPYRDLVRPGGIRERGFLRLWSIGLRRTRQSYSIIRESRRRPPRDEWWRDLAPELGDITVPALICGSFSDNCLHSRGSIAGFERISSAERHLVTHRSGKWATFYSDEARALQLQFLDQHLRDLDTPMLPRVRLEVRESRDQVVERRDEAEWPLARTDWTPLHLGATGLRDTPAPAAGSIRFRLRDQAAGFGWTVPEDLELTGPMSLRLHLEVHDTDDVDLVVGVEKWRAGRYVGFEGSYGFGRDRVTTGWQTASWRALDTRWSRPFQPVPSCTAREPLAPGEIVAVDVALGPSATVFRAGEQLRLVVAGRWLSPRNPLFGQFPANYATGRRGAATLHWGPEHDAHLLVPVIPAAGTGRARPAG